MRNDELVAEIVDHVFARLGEAGYDALNRTQKCLVCVWSACGEIGNGGFDQFFFNTSGDWAAETPEAFRAVGAPGLARIVEDAMGVFPKGRAVAGLESRRAQVESLPASVLARLSQLDEEFQAAEGNLDERIAWFVRANERTLRE